jgi:hypothetical protein
LARAAKYSPPGPPPTTAMRNLSPSRSAILKICRLSDDRQWDG